MSVMPLNAVPMSLDTRLPTGVGEFDRVLGGSLVAGSVVLIGVIPVSENPLSCWDGDLHGRKSKSPAVRCILRVKNRLSQVAMRAESFGATQQPEKHWQKPMLKWSAKP